MQTDTRCVGGGNSGQTRDNYVQEVVAEMYVYSGYPSGGRCRLDNKRQSPGPVSLCFSTSPGRNEQKKTTHLKLFENRAGPKVLQFEF